jgi:hypothetical protein
MKEGPDSIKWIAERERERERKIMKAKKPKL